MSEFLSEKELLKLSTATGGEFNSQLAKKIWQRITETKNSSVNIPAVFFKHDATSQREYVQEEKKITEEVVLKPKPGDPFVFNKTKTTRTVTENVPVPKNGDEQVYITYFTPAPSYKPNEAYVFVPAPFDKPNEAHSFTFRYKGLNEDGEYFEKNETTTGKPSSIQSKIIGLLEDGYQTLDDDIQEDKRLYSVSFLDQHRPTNPPSSSFSLPPFE
jgi:hypothetical protein